MAGIVLSRAARLYEGIRAGGLQFGRLLTKDHLSDLLGEPFDRYRSVIYPTIGMLERNDQRTLVCQFQIGYKIAHPRETEGIAEGRVSRSTRQILRGGHTIKHTDWSYLTDEEKRRLETLQRGMNSVRQELVRVKRRLSHVEERLDLLEGEPQLSEEEVAFLRRMYQQSR